MPADWLTVADLLDKYDNTVAVNIAYILAMPRCESGAWAGMTGRPPPPNWQI